LKYLVIDGAIEQQSKDVLNKQLATYMERSNSMELDADKTDFVRSNSI
jgi:hypothetical protein